MEEVMKQTTGNTMDHYQQLIADKILSVQGKKDYCLSVLGVGNLESWESKEYNQLIEQYDQQLIELNNRTSQSDSKNVSFGGMDGSVKLTRFGAELRGPWASHTGFRSLTGIHCMKEATEQAYDNFIAASNYGFLVGEEHRADGWKQVDIHNTEARVRLPHWHKGVVAQCLEDYGFELSCPHNRFWTFNLTPTVTEFVIRDFLTPILAAATRFADERQLAEQLDAQAQSMGYLKRQPLITGAAQTSLF